VEGDDHREAYTAIVQGEQLSPEKYYLAEAEVVDIGRRQHVRHRYVRGAVALSWSKTSSCTKGLRRNLGDLAWPAVAQAVPGRDGKSDWTKPSGNK
jgi:hypothetical protein